MCGIAGYVGAGDEHALRRMVASIAHRGPDGEGVVMPAPGGVGLAHRRLSIIDLSPSGSQPMCDDAGRFWITFNGEIYNYRELRRDLEARGVRFRSSSDTEVLLAAWREFGEAALPRLNGMFAFAIWDVHNEQLFAARDRLGIKPLYWSSVDQTLLFASEIKALFASGLIVAEPDPQVTNNPWHYPSAPRTGFKNVQKLKPGELLRFRHGQLSIRQWWRIPDALDHISTADLGELEHLVEDAVRMQTVADVPVGVLLSGGLDSSLIASILAHTSRVRSFTIKYRASDKRFENMPEDDVYARQVAQLLDTEHVELEITPSVICHLPALVWHVDEPIVDPASINAFLIAQRARQEGCVVLLSGIGADEVFGGYRKHLACLLASRYSKFLPTAIQPLARALGARLPVAGASGGYRYLRWLKRFLGFAFLADTDRFLASDQSVSKTEYEQLFNPDSRLVYDELEEVQNRRAAMNGPGSYLTRMCRLDSTVFLPDHNLTYFDKSTMAAGVEARPPLIDHRLVEWAFRLPDAQRISGLNQKVALRRTAARWLPDAILNRPKAPFGSPLRGWIRNDLRPMVDEMLSDSAIRARGIYAASAVRNLIERDRSGDEDNAFLIFRILWQELWFQTFIDRNGGSGPLPG